MYQVTNVRLIDTTNIETKTTVKVLKGEGTEF